MKHLIQIYTCKCNPNFTYKTKSSFTKHLESKRHYSYQENVNKIENRIKIQQLERDIKKLKSEIRIWKEKYLELDLSRVNTIDFLC